MDGLGVPGKSYGHHFRCQQEAPLPCTIFDLMLQRYGLGMQLEHRSVVQVCWLGYM